MRTPDRDRNRDPAGEFDPRRTDDGIDEAAGGADSSPYETEPSGEKAAKVAEPPEQSGGRRQDSSP